MIRPTRSKIVATLGPASNSPSAIDRMIRAGGMALLTGLDQEREPGQEVRLMTLHASKGLEFPHVFLAGVEEDEARAATYGANRTPTVVVNGRTVDNPFTDAELIALGAWDVGYLGSEHSVSTVLAELKADTEHTFNEAVDRFEADVAPSFDEIRVGYSGSCLRAALSLESSASTSGFGSAPPEIRSSLLMARSNCAVSIGFMR